MKSSENPIYGHEDPYKISVLAGRLRDVPGREASRRQNLQSNTPEPLSARKEPQLASRLPEIQRSSSVPRDLKRANLPAMESFRAMLRQRYGRRGNLQKVFSEWDRGCLGYVRPEDVHYMAGKFGLTITLEEATLLVASANKSKSGVLSLEEFLELVRADDPEPTSVTQEADFDAVRSSLENRAAEQRDQAMHSFLRQKVRSRLHYLTQAMLRRDRDGRGLINFKDFLVVMDSLQLPAESVSARHWEKFFLAEGGTALGLDYRAFAQNFRTDSPERPKNPLVDDYRRRLGPSPSPPPGEQVFVLDGRRVPVHTLELLQSKARRVKRILKEKYTTGEELRRAVQQSAGPDGISQQDLRRFLSAEVVADPGVSPQDVEGFLATIQYSAYGIADVQAVVKSVFIEEYRDDSLTRRIRGLPPSKVLSSVTPLSPVRLTELVRELEEKLYAQRCRQAFQAFRFFDTDADGYVSREDFARGLQHLNIPHSPGESDQLLDHLDSNRNGFLSYHEFASGLHLDTSRTSQLGSVLGAAKDMYQKHSEAFRTPEKKEIWPEPVPRPLLKPPGSMTKEVFQSISSHSIDEKSRFQPKNLNPISYASEDKERRNRMYAARLNAIKEYRDRESDSIAQMERAAEEQKNRKIWHKASAVESYEKVSHRQRCRIYPL